MIGDSGRPLQSKPRPSGDAHTPGQSGHPTGTRTRGSRLILERARPDRVAPGFQAPRPCGCTPHLCGPIRTPASPVPAPLPRRAPRFLGTSRGHPGQSWQALTFWIRFSAMGQAAGAAAGPRVPGCRLAGLLRVRPGAVRECAGGGAGLFCFRLRLLGRSLRPPRRAPPAWHTGKCSPRLGLCRPRGRRPVTRG